MTNILMLPQLQATFVIANNGDWTDQIQFLQPDPNDPNGQTLIPLDLTGITFRGQIRPSALSPVVLLEIGTDDSTLVNSGQDGKLTWNVFAIKFNGMEGGSGVFDLLAFGDGHTINLFQKAGPASVTINEGITK